MSTRSNRAQGGRRLRSGRLRRLVIFAMLGTLMFCSKLLMEVLPNIHLLGMLTMAYTLVYRTRALIPIYVYVALEGLYAVYTGRVVWWVPYLYMWALLWVVTVLLPRRMPRRLAAAVYPLVCMLHGLLFGILYAPAYMLLFGLTFDEALIWIAAGAGFDIMHAVGNLFAGLLVLPLSQLLRRLEAQ